MFGLRAPKRAVATLSRKLARPRIMRARYDSAQTTDENRRHWANADSLSADAANSPDVRQTLRNRARYEIGNNSIAKGMIETLANDLIGTGPRLQLQTEDPDVNRAVERSFSAWAKEVRLADKLRTMRKAEATDGEAFCLQTSNSNLRHSVSLDLKLVEADRVTDPTMRTVIQSESWVDGIKFDDDGEPVSYRVLRRHPGGPDGWSTQEFDDVPADEVIHIFRADRPEQRRGIPHVTPALPLFAMLRRFTLAVVAAAETVAEFAMVLYSDAPPDADDEEAPESMDTLELERRMATVLPQGWKLGQVTAQQPTTTYKEFKREIVNEIARCLNMPFNVAAGNSSGYNYASGRLDHQDYRRSIRVDQDRYGCDLMDVVFAAWLREAQLVEGLLPQKLRMRDSDVPAHVWFWDGPEHVDPQKEATAQAKRLETGTTTLAIEYAKQGLDWEEQLEQRGREIALAKKLGVPIPGLTSPAQPPEDEEQEEEETEDEEVRDAA